VGDNKREDRTPRPANQVDKKFSAVGFIDNIVNHNVEHRFFLYFVFESPIFASTDFLLHRLSSSRYERLQDRGDLVQFVTRLVRKASVEPASDRVSHSTCGKPPVSSS